MKRSYYYLSILELLQNAFPNGRIIMNTTYSRQTYRSNSNKNVPEERTSLTTHTSTIISDHHRNRDSGTSSPQPNNTTNLSQSTDEQQQQQPSGSLSVEYFASRRRTQRTEEIIETECDDDLSDSNDSVFSSASSVDSILNQPDLDMRDIYLGGSCMLRTSWRQNLVIPLLERRNISYHLPKLHESIHCSVETEHGEADRNHALDTSSSNDSGICITNNRKKRSPQMRLITDSIQNTENVNGEKTINVTHSGSRRNMFNEELLDNSRVLLFVITNETRSLAPMTLAAYCIGLGYHVVLCVQMLSENCILGEDRVRIHINLIHQ